MNIWLIEPEDPVIFRDGRPFNPTPGARAISMPFPFPSTIAGAVRTRDGQDDSGRFRSEASEIARVKQLRIKGPVLVELTSNGEVNEWYVPSPNDAVVVEKDESSPDEVLVRPLVPLELPEGAVTDLPKGLVPVGLPVRDPRKPFERAPRFWRWKVFERWLCCAGDIDTAASHIGFSGPSQESRVHVGIRNDTNTADEDAGALFQTGGLEFTRNPSPAFLSQACGLALMLATDAVNIREGFGSLGGERRLVQWRKSAKGLPPVPTRLLDEISQRRHCRVVLLTPSYFGKGWKPERLLRLRNGVRPELRALAMQRPNVVSGWDFETSGPKPTRRLTPAGTVLFLDLKGGTSAEVQAWAEDLWMNCISDDEQDCRDGFGLAVLGAWNGVRHRMEV